MWIPLASSVKYIIVFNATSIHFTPSSHMCASKVWCSKNSFYCGMVCNDGNIVTIKAIPEDTAARTSKSVTRHKKMHYDCKITVHEHSYVV